MIFYKKMLKSNASIISLSANFSGLRRALVSHISVGHISVGHISVASALMPALASVLLLSPLVTSAKAQPSGRIISAIDTRRSEAILSDSQGECPVSDTSPDPDRLAFSELANDDYVQTLLLDAIAAAEQVEDARQRGLAFAQIGDSYACLQQYEQADTALRQAIAAGEEIVETEIRARLLKDVASNYGRSIGDIETMNAVLTQMLGVIASDENATEMSDYFDEVTEAVRLYAESGQYQQLRDLIDRFDDEADQRVLVRVASPTLMGAESEADRSLIASLFSGFDLAAMARELVISPEALRTFDTPTVRYTSALHDSAPEGVSDYSPALIEAFVDEQLALIAALPNVRAQLVSLDTLSRFLIEDTQIGAALFVLETATQQLEAAVDAQRIRNNGNFYAARLHKSKARAYFQLGEFEAAVAAIAGTSRNPVAPLNQIETLLEFVRSRTVSLSAQQKRELLAQAEALLPMLEDEIQQLSVTGYIANNYAAVGDVEKARTFLPVMTATLPSAEGLTQELSLAIAYSRLLAVTGEVEKAIAFAESISTPYYLQHFLPGQLVAAGQYNRAEETLATISSPDEYFATAESMIDEYASIEDAYAFTARTLQKLQDANLLSEAERQQLGDDDDAYEDYVQMELERQRTRTAFELIEEAVLKPDLRSIFRRSLLTDEEKADMQQLIEALDNHWLRADLVQRYFDPEEALSIIDADTEITTPESLLLINIVDLIEADETEAAMTMLQRVRSPYIRSLALVHIANSYVIAEENAQSSSQQPE